MRPAPVLGVDGESLGSYADSLAPCERQRDNLWTYPEKWNSWGEQHGCVSAVNCLW